jgi:resolvase-like protein
VVWTLDLLARSLTQLIETIERLAAQGIGFHSLTEAIETTTAGGRLVFHIFASLAELERAISRERTRAGLEAARARGRTGGRPPALTARELTAAKAMWADPTLTVADAVGSATGGPDGGDRRARLIQGGRHRGLRTCVTLTSP